MSSDSFVGRGDVVSTLVDVLEGGEKGRGKLTIQGIAGPGGIGKSMLLDHAMERAELEARGYLTLSISGRVGQGGLVASLRRAVAEVDAPSLKDKPAGFYFPAVTRVLAMMEALKQEAVVEAGKSSGLDAEAISEWIDVAFDTGEAINDVSKATAKWVDVKKLRKYKTVLEKGIPKLIALQAERPSLLGRLGLGSDWALRNAIRENPAYALADALMADLSAILSGYRRSEWFKPAHRKLDGIERLLIVIDDYEFTHEAIGGFLVRELLPMLRAARFETVAIILGRDVLASTHTEFDGKDYERHQLKQIVVDRLVREDLDRLLENNGFHSVDIKDRAWRDTEGYPYYVGLWMEEANQGGGGAEMARRFHRRTTRWMSDRQTNWLDVTLFMDRVNKETLRRMLDEPGDADAAFRWFEKEGSVRDASAGADAFRVREYLRTRLLNYLRNSDPARYRELELRAQRLTSVEETA